MANRVPKSNLPLSGKRIILTQSNDQCEKLEKMLYVEQAMVIKIPAIGFKLVNHLEQIERALANLEQYDLLILTSQNSFLFFHQLLKEKNLTLPAKLKIAVVGDETKKAVEQAGFKVDYVPDQQKTSDQLAEFLQKNISLSKKNVLFPKSSLSVSKLPKKLRDSGAWVDDIILYETSTNLEAKSIFEYIMGNSIDWILFSSPSAVRSFFSFAPQEEVRSWIFDYGIKLGSIGETTTKALLECQVPVSVQSPRPSSKLLIETVKEYEEYEQF